jgi:hypothetical protein
MESIVGMLVVVDTTVPKTNLRKNPTLGFPVVVVVVVHPPVLITKTLTSFHNKVFPPRYFTSHSFRAISILCRRSSNRFHHRYPNRLVRHRRLDFRRPPTSLPPHRRDQRGGQEIFCRLDKRGQARQGNVLSHPPSSRKGHYARCNLAQTRQEACQEEELGSVVVGQTI